ncbi:unnamed protein product, partial [Amoebophrya sp. A25]
ELPLEEQVTFEERAGRKLPEEKDFLHTSPRPNLSPKQPPPPHMSPQQPHMSPPSFGKSSFLRGVTSLEDFTFDGGFASL